VAALMYILFLILRCSDWWVVGSVSKISLRELEIRVARCSFAVSFPLVLAIGQQKRKFDTLCKDTRIQQRREDLTSRSLQVSG
jgi:hypothetical protein